METRDEDFATWWQKEYLSEFDGVDAGHVERAFAAGRQAERHIRRLLAVRVAMPHTYYDDGEAQGQEHGIVIDFMREPVADIDAKLRALNVARAECNSHKIA